MYKKKEKCKNYKKKKKTWCIDFVDCYVEIFFYQMLIHFVFNTKNNENDIQKYYHQYFGHLYFSYHVLWLIRCSNT